MAAERLPPGFDLWLRNEAGRRGVPLRPSFERWLAAIPELATMAQGALNILVVDEPAGRDLNLRFRGRNYATNVLSFPHQPLPGEPPGPLGDLALCAPVIAREAAGQAKTVRDHYAHLVIHGTLHLLGYEHETTADAEHMEAIETTILARLGIADPYTVRG